MADKPAVSENEILMRRRGLVKDWYLKEFNSDKLGNQINPNITFNEVVFSLFLKESIYGVIGVGDSVIRERIFAEIADLYWHGIYEFPLKLWQNGPSYSFFKEIKPPFEKMPVMTEEQAKLYPLV